MNIILCDRYCLSVLIVPVVSVNTLIVANGSNETMNSLDGRFRLIDNKDLRTLEWSSFFPVKKDYRFVKAGSFADGHIYVTFLELMKKFKYPVRVIMTTNDKIPYFEQLMSIDKFSWSFDKVGDINYSISLTEIPENLIDFIDDEKTAIGNIGNFISDKRTELKEFNLEKLKNIKIQETAKNKLQKLGLIKKDEL